MEVGMSGWVYVAGDQLEGSGGFDLAYW